MDTGTFNICGICKSLLIFLSLAFIPTACTTDYKASMDSMASEVKARPWRGNAEAHYQLACHYQDRGRHGEALEELQKVVAINPQDIRAYNGIGISCDALKDFPRAFLAYEKALKLNPRAGYVYNNLGYSYVLQKRYHEAALTFQKAVEHSNDMAIKNKIARNLNMAQALSENPQVATDEQKQAPTPSLAQELAFTSNLERESYIKSMLIQRDPLTAHAPASPRPASASVSADSIRNGEVAIEVANGNGVRNMAKSVGNYLKNRGYRVVSVTNADSYSYPTGSVSYRGDGQATAQEIAAIFPGDVNVKKSKLTARKDVRVRVLIGEDMIPYKKVFMEDKG